MNDAGRPDFIIIGAAKSGTTSLFRHLGRHEGISLPDIKEPEYYAYGTRGLPSPDFKDTVEDRDHYGTLFNGRKEGTITGEASPAYLYFSHVAEELHDALPGVKLIAILRNPIDRAYSHYHNARRALTEPLGTFREAANAELKVLGREWRVGDHPRPYLRFSLYGRQLQRYYDQFPDAQIKVISFERFAECTEEAVGEVLSFLELPADVGVDWQRVGRKNSGFTFRSIQVYKTLQPTSSFSRTLRDYIGDSLFSLVQGGVAKLNRKSIPPLSSEVRDGLRDVFAEDVQRLKSLTGKEFSRWGL